MREVLIVIEGLNYAQRERLTYIDFCLEYFGQISRTELTEKFQTGLASCSRDLAMYRELAPGNAVLTHKKKNIYAVISLNQFLYMTQKQY